MEKTDSFFDRSGTLQSLGEWNSAVQQMKSQDGTTRLGGLGRLVALVMSLLA